MKNLLTLIYLLGISITSIGQDSLKESVNQFLALDSIQNTLKFQKTGTVDLDNAVLTIPIGFKYADKDNSRKILVDLWGNPDDSSISGMIVPDSFNILDPNSWAFTISFDEMGFVKDDDADKINYEDLLKTGREEMIEANKERIAQGYEAIDWVGWASPPFYDKNAKILHWAKELKFGEAEENTLNYNLRVLGRKGVFVLNAVAGVNSLAEVKSKMEPIIRSLSFKEGHKYADYIEGSDHIAEWTVGGLVAGKILSKIGIFALLAKFGKVIFIALAAGGTAFVNYFRRRKSDDENEVVATNDGVINDVNSNEVDTNDVDPNDVDPNDADPNIESNSTTEDQDETKSIN